MRESSAVDRAPGHRCLPGQHLDDRPQHSWVLSQTVLVLVDRGNPLPDLLGVVALELVAGASGRSFFDQCHDDLF